MIFADPTFNAIYILGFMVSLITLPKLFVMDLWPNNPARCRVRWKDLITGLVISVIPLINVISGIIGIIFWSTWIIKRVAFMDTLRRVLNEEVF